MDKIEQGFKIIGTIEFEIGKILLEKYKKGTYKLSGSHINTWQDFLKELGITYTKAQQLMDVVETFPNLQNCVNYDRLKSIAKLYKLGLIKPEDLDEVYQMAVTLPIKDWRDEYNMLEGKSTYLTCEHKNVEEYVRCKDCGRWIKV